MAGTGGGGPGRGQGQGQGQGQGEETVDGAGSSMTVELPPGLQKFFKVTLGMTWPEGSEGGLKAMSAAWADFKKEVGDVGAELASSMPKFDAGMNGKTADALDEYLKEMKKSLADSEEAAAAFAKMCKTTAADLQKGKIMLIVMAVMVLASFIALLASLFGALFTGPFLKAAQEGLKALWLAIVEAVKRATWLGAAQVIRQTAWTGLKYAGGGALLMGGLDYGIQFWQNVGDQRDGFDWNSIGKMAIGGAIGGAAAGVATGIARGAYGSLFQKPGLGGGKLGGKAGGSSVPPGLGKNAGSVPKGPGKGTGKNEGPGTGAKSGEGKGPGVNEKPGLNEKGEAPGSGGKPGEGKGSGSGEKSGPEGKGGKSGEEKGKPWWEPPPLFLKDGTPVPGWVRSLGHLGFAGMQMAMVVASNPLVNMATGAGEHEVWEGILGGATNFHMSTPGAPGKAERAIAGLGAAFSNGLKSAFNGDRSSRPGSIFGEGAPEKSSLIIPRGETAGRDAGSGHTGKNTTGGQGGDSAGRPVTTSDGRPGADLGGAKLTAPPEAGGSGQPSTTSGAPGGGERGAPGSDGRPSTESGPGTGGSNLGRGEPGTSPGSDSTRFLEGTPGEERHGAPASEHGGSGSGDQGDVGGRTSSGGQAGSVPGSTAPESKVPVSADGVPEAPSGGHGSPRDTPVPDTVRTPVPGESTGGSSNAPVTNIDAGQQVADPPPRQEPGGTSPDVREPVHADPPKARPQLTVDTSPGGTGHSGFTQHAPVSPLPEHERAAVIDAPVSPISGTDPPTSPAPWSTGGSSSGHTTTATPASTVPTTPTGDSGKTGGGQTSLSELPRREQPTTVSQSGSGVPERGGQPRTETPVTRQEAPVSKPDLTKPLEAPSPAKAVPPSVPDRPASVDSRAGESSRPGPERGQQPADRPTQSGSERVDSLSPDRHGPAPEASAPERSESKSQGPLQQVLSSPSVDGRAPVSGAGESSRPGPEKVQQPADRPAPTPDKPTPERPSAERPESKSPAPRPQQPIPAVVDRPVPERPGTERPGPSVPADRVSAEPPSTHRPAERPAPRAAGREEQDAAAAAIAAGYVHQAAADAAVTSSSGGREKPRAGTEGKTENWDARRDSAQSAKFSSERFVPAPEGGSGKIEPIRHEARHFEVAPGRWVLEVAVHADLLLPDRRTGGPERGAFADKLQQELDRRYNFKHTVRTGPFAGSRLHFAVDAKTPDLATESWIADGQIAGDPAGRPLDRYFGFLGLPEGKENSAGGRSLTSEQVAHVGALPEKLIVPHGLMETSTFASDGQAKAPAPPEAGVVSDGPGPVQFLSGRDFRKAHKVVDGNGDIVYVAMPGSGISYERGLDGRWSQGREKHGEVVSSKTALPIELPLADGSNLVLPRNSEIVKDEARGGPVAYRQVKDNAGNWLAEPRTFLPTPDGRWAETAELVSPPRHDAWLAAANRKYRAAGTLHNIADRYGQGVPESERLNNISWESLKNLLLGSVEDAFAAVYEAARRTDGVYLRWTQIAAEHAFEGGKRVQMDAGEGKTWLYVVDAARHAVRPHLDSVHAITTRDSLAEKDLKVYVRVLGKLGVDVHRVDQKEPSPLPEQGRPTIYVGTQADFHFSKLNHGRVPGQGEDGGNRQRAINDEVDEAVIYSETNYIISEGTGEPASGAVTAAVQRAHDFIEANLENGNLTERDFGREPGQEGGRAALTADGLAKVEDLLGRRLKDREHHRLDMAATARWEYQLGIHYLISEAKIVILNQVTHATHSDPKTSTESRWNGGLAQAIEAKHGLTIRADPKSSKGITPSELFSKANYESVVGASGTALGNDKLYARQGLPSDVEVIPRYYKSLLKFLPEQKVENVDALLGAMAKDIYEQWLRGEQPQLVLLHRNDLVQALAEQVRALGAPVNALDGDWFLQQGVDAEAAVEAKVAKAGEARQITISNNMLNRGHDISVSDDLAAQGGLIVRVSAYESTLRAILDQAFNRTARSGAAGLAKIYSLPGTDPYQPTPNPGVEHAVIQYKGTESQHQAPPGSADRQTPFKAGLEPPDSATGRQIEPDQPRHTRGLIGSQPNAPPVETNDGDPLDAAKQPSRFPSLGGVRSVDHEAPADGRTPGHGRASVEGKQDDTEERTIPGGSPVAGQAPATGQDVGRSTDGRMPDSQNVGPSASSDRLRGEEPISRQKREPGRRDGLGQSERELLYHDVRREVVDLVKGNLGEVRAQEEAGRLVGRGDVTDRYGDVPSSERRNLRSAAVHIAQELVSGDRVRVRGGADEPVTQVPSDAPHMSPGPSVQPGRDPAGYASVAELVGDLREATGSRGPVVEPLLGPDLFGLHQAPEPPEVMRGYDYSGLTAGQGVDFLEKLDLASGRELGFGQVDPANLTDRRGWTIETERDDDALDAWAPGDVAPLDKVTSTPRLVHAIWLGGPLRDADPMRGFWNNFGAAAAQSNENVVPVLWTDVPRSQIESVFTEKPPAEGPDPLHDVREFVSWARENHIQLINVGEVFSSAHPMQLQEHFLSEVGKRAGPGYAAASDILRVEILHRFGGMYTDGDNVVNSFLDLVRVAGTGEGYAVHRVGNKLANSAFVMSKGHPFAQVYLDQLRENYGKSQRELMPASVNSFGQSFFRTGMGRVHRNSVILRTGPEALRSAGNRIGLSLEAFPATTDIGLSSDGSWLRPPSESVVPAVGRGETLETAKRVVQTLVRGLYNRDGDLHLTAVEPAVLRDSDPGLVWEAALSYLAADPVLAGMVRTVTDRHTYTGEDHQVWLPPGARALLDIDFGDERHNLGEVQHGATLRTEPASTASSSGSTDHAVPSSTYPGSYDDPGLKHSGPTTSDIYLADPVHRSEWEQLRANAAVTPVHSEYVDVFRNSPAPSVDVAPAHPEYRDRIGKALASHFGTSDKVSVDYDVRRMEVRPGRWVREITHRLHLDAKPGVTDLEVGSLQYRAHQGVSHLYNHAHTLPGGDQLHVRLEFVADPAEAHSSIEVHPGAFQSTHGKWGATIDATTIAHEVGHKTGLRDRYTLRGVALSDKAPRAGHLNIHGAAVADVRGRVSDDGGLMTSAQHSPNVGLSEKELQAIENSANAFLVQDTAYDVLYGGTPPAGHGPSLFDAARAGDIGALHALAVDGHADSLAQLVNSAKELDGGAAREALKGIAATGDRQALAGMIRAGLDWRMPELGGLSPSESLGLSALAAQPDYGAYGLLLQLENEGFEGAALARTGDWTALAAYHDRLSVQFGHLTANQQEPVQSIPLESLDRPDGSGDTRRIESGDEAPRVALDPTVKAHEWAEQTEADLGAILDSYHDDGARPVPQHGGSTVAESLANKDGASGRQVPEEGKPEIAGKPTDTADSVHRGLPDYLRDSRAMGPAKQIGLIRSAPDLAEVLRQMAPQVLNWTGVDQAQLLHLEDAKNNKNSTLMGDGKDLVVHGDGRLYRLNAKAQLGWDRMTLGDEAEKPLVAKGKAKFNGEDGYDSSRPRAFNLGGTFFSPPLVVSLSTTFPLGASETSKSSRKSELADSIALEISPARAVTVPVAYSFVLTDLAEQTAEHTATSEGQVDLHVPTGLAHEESAGAEITRQAQAGARTVVPPSAHEALRTAGITPLTAEPPRRSAIEEITIDRAGFPDFYHQVEAKLDPRFAKEVRVDADGRQVVKDFVSRENIKAQLLKMAAYDGDSHPELGWIRSEPITKGSGKGFEFRPRVTQLEMRAVPRWIRVDPTIRPDAKVTTTDRRHFESSEESGAERKGGVDLHVATGGPVGTAGIAAGPAGGFSRGKGAVEKHGESQAAKESVESKLGAVRYEMVWDIEVRPVGQPGQRLDGVVTSKQWTDTDTAIRHRLRRGPDHVFRSGEDRTHFLPLEGERGEVVFGQFREFSSGEWFHDRIAPMLSQVPSRTWPFTDIPMRTGLVLSTGEFITQFTNPELAKGISRKFGEALARGGVLKEALTADELRLLVPRMLGPGLDIKLTRAGFGHEYETTITLRATLDDIRDGNLVSGKDTTTTTRVKDSDSGGLTNSRATELTFGAKLRMLFIRPGVLRASAMGKYGWDRSAEIENSVKVNTDRKQGGSLTGDGKLDDRPMREFRGTLHVSADVVATRRLNETVRKLSFGSRGKNAPQEQRIGERLQREVPVEFQVPESYVSTSAPKTPDYLRNGFPPELPDWQPTTDPAPPGKAASGPRTLDDIELVTGFRGSAELQHRALRLLRELSGDPVFDPAAKSGPSWALRQTTSPESLGHNRRLFSAEVMTDGMHYGRRRADMAATVGFTLKPRLIDEPISVKEYEEATRELKGASKASGKTGTTTGITVGATGGAMISGSGGAVADGRFVSGVGGRGRLMVALEVLKTEWGKSKSGQIENAESTKTASHPEGKHLARIGIDVTMTASVQQRGNLDLNLTSPKPATVRGETGSLRDTQLVWLTDRQLHELQGGLATVEGQPPRPERTVPTPSHFDPLKTAAASLGLGAVRDSFDLTDQIQNLRDGLPADLAERLLPDNRLETPHDNRRQMTRFLAEVGATMNGNLNGGGIAPLRLEDRFSGQTYYLTADVSIAEAPRFTGIEQLGSVKASNSTQLTVEEEGSRTSVPVGINVTGQGLLTGQDKATGAVGNSLSASDAFGMRAHKRSNKSEVRYEQSAERSGPAAAFHAESTVFLAIRRHDRVFASVEVQRPLAFHSVPEETLPPPKTGRYGETTSPESLPAEALTPAELRRWRTAAKAGKLPGLEFGKYWSEHFFGEVESLREAAVEALTKSGVTMTPRLSAHLQAAITPATVKAGLNPMRAGTFRIPLPDGLNRELELHARLPGDLRFAGSSASITLDGKVTVTHTEKTETTTGNKAVIDTSPEFRVDERSKAGGTSAPYSNQAGGMAVGIPLAKQDGSAETKAPAVQHKRKMIDPVSKEQFASDEKITRALLADAEFRLVAREQQPRPLRSPRVGGAEVRSADSYVLRLRDDHAREVTGQSLSESLKDATKDLADRGKAWDEAVRKQRGREDAFDLARGALDRYDELRHQWDLIRELAQKRPSDPDRRGALAKDFDVAHTEFFKATTAVEAAETAWWEAWWKYQLKVVREQTVDAHRRWRPRRDWSLSGSRSYPAGELNWEPALALIPEVSEPTATSQDGPAAPIGDLRGNAEVPEDAAGSHPTRDRPLFVRRDEAWRVRRDGATPTRVGAEQFDPDSRKGGLRVENGRVTGKLNLIRFDIRHFEVAPGNWVVELSVPLDLISPDGVVDASARQELADRIQGELDEHFNYQHRWEHKGQFKGSQLHFTIDARTPDGIASGWDTTPSRSVPVEVRDSEGSPGQPVPAANQVQWDRADPVEVQLHDLFHFTGLLEGHPDPGRLFDRPGGRGGIMAGVSTEDKFLTAGQLGLIANTVATARPAISHALTDTGAPARPTLRAEAADRIHSVFTDGPYNEEHRPTNAPPKRQRDDADEGGRSKRAKQAGASAGPRTSKPGITGETRNLAFDRLVSPDHRTAVTPEGYLGTLSGLVESEAPMAFVVNAILPHGKVEDIRAVVEAILAGAEGFDGRVGFVFGINAPRGKSVELAEAMDRVSETLAGIPHPAAAVGITFDFIGKKKDQFPFGVVRNKTLGSGPTKALTEAFAEAGKHPYISVQDFDIGGRSVPSGAHVFNHFETKFSDGESTVRPLLFVGGYRVAEPGKDPAFTAKVTVDMQIRDRLVSIHPLLPYTPEPNLFFDALPVLVNADIRFGIGGSGEAAGLVSKLGEWNAKELGAAYRPTAAEPVGALSPEARTGLAAELGPALLGLRDGTATEIPPLLGELLDSAAAMLAGQVRDLVLYGRQGDLLALASSDLLTMAQGEFGQDKGPESSYDGLVERARADILAEPRVDAAYLLDPANGFSDPNIEALRADAENIRHPIRGKSFDADYVDAAVATDLDRLHKEFIKSGSLSQTHESVGTVPNRYLATREDKRGIRPKDYRAVFQLLPHEQREPFRPVRGAEGQRTAWEPPDPIHREWLGGEPNSRLDPALSAPVGELPVTAGLAAVHRELGMHGITTARADLVVNRMLGYLKNEVLDEVADVAEVSLYHAVAAATADTRNSGDSRAQANQLRHDVIDTSLGLGAPQTGPLNEPNKITDRKDPLGIGVQLATWPAADGHLYKAFLQTSRVTFGEDAQENQSAVNALDTVGRFIATHLGTTLVVHKPDGTAPRLEPFSDATKKTAKTTAKKSEVHVQAVEENGALTFHPYRPTATLPIRPALDPELTGGAGGGTRSHHPADAPPAAAEASRQSAGSTVTKETFATDSDAAHYFDTQYGNLRGVDQALADENCFEVTVQGSFSILEGDTFVAGGGRPTRVGAANELAGSAFREATFAEIFEHMRAQPAEAQGMVYLGGGGAEGHYLLVHKNEAGVVNLVDVKNQSIGASSTDRPVVGFVPLLWTGAAELADGPGRRSLDHRDRPGDLDRFAQPKYGDRVTSSSTPAPDTTGTASGTDDGKSVRPASPQPAPGHDSDSHSVISATTSDSGELSRSEVELLLGVPHSFDLIGNPSPEQEIRELAEMLAASVRFQEDDGLPPPSVIIRGLKQNADQVAGILRAELGSDPARPLPVISVSQNAEARVTVEVDIPPIPRGADFAAKGNALGGLSFDAGAGSDKAHWERLYDALRPPSKPVFYIFVTGKGDKFLVNGSLIDGARLAKHVSNAPGFRPYLTDTSVDVRLIGVDPADPGASFKAAQEFAKSLRDDGMFRVVSAATRELVIGPTGHAVPAGKGYFGMASEIMPHDVVWQERHGAGDREYGMAFGDPRYLYGATQQTGVTDQSRRVVFETHKDSSGKLVKTLKLAAWAGATAGGRARPVELTLTSSGGRFPVPLTNGLVLPVPPAMLAELIVKSSVFKQLTAGPVRPPLLILTNDPRARPGVSSVANAELLAALRKLSGPWLSFDYEGPVQYDSEKSFQMVKKGAKFTENPPVPLRDVKHVTSADVFGFPVRNGGQEQADQAQILEQFVKSVQNGSADLSGVWGTRKPLVVVVDSPDGGHARLEIDSGQVLEVDGRQLGETLLADPEFRRQVEADPDRPVVLVARNGGARVNFGGLGFDFAGALREARLLNDVYSPKGEAPVAPDRITAAAGTEFVLTSGLRAGDLQVKALKVKSGEPAVLYLPTPGDSDKYLQVIRWAKNLTADTVRTYRIVSDSGTESKPSPWPKGELPVFVIVSSGAEGYRATGQHGLGQIKNLTAARLAELLRAESELRHLLGRGSRPVVLLSLDGETTGGAEFNESFSEGGYRRKLHASLGLPTLSDDGTITLRDKEFATHAPPSPASAGIIGHARANEKLGVHGAFYPSDEFDAHWMDQLGLNDSAGRQQYYFQELTTKNAKGETVTRRDAYVGPGAGRGLPSWLINGHGSRKGFAFAMKTDRPLQFGDALGLGGGAAAHVFLIMYQQARPDPSTPVVLCQCSVNAPSNGPGLNQAGDVKVEWQKITGRAPELHAATDIVESIPASVTTTVVGGGLFTEVLPAGEAAPMVRLAELAASWIAPVTITFPGQSKKIPGTLVEEVRQTARLVARAAAWRKRKNAGLPEVIITGTGSGNGFGLIAGSGLEMRIERSLANGVGKVFIEELAVESARLARLGLAIKPEHLAIRVEVVRSANGGPPFVTVEVQLPQHELGEEALEDFADDFGRPSAAEDLNEMFGALVPDVTPAASTNTAKMTTQATISLALAALDSRRKATE